VCWKTDSRHNAVIVTPGWRVAERFDPHRTSAYDRILRHRPPRWRTIGPEPALSARREKKHKEREKEPGWGYQEREGGMPRRHCRGEVFGGT